MGDTNGSPTQQIIGMPTYQEPTTGKIEFVTKREPSYFRDLMDVFNHYPVFKHYGLTPQTAMDLTVDKWYKIRDEVKTLPEEPNKHEDAMVEIMRELVRQRQQAE